MSEQAVGLLNVGNKGSVPLLYVGENLFRADVPGSPPISLSKVKAAHAQGLVTFHDPGFLDRLSSDTPIAPSGLLDGIDVDALGGDPIQKGAFRPAGQEASGGISMDATAGGTTPAGGGLAAGPAGNGQDGTVAALPSPGGSGGLFSKLRGAAPQEGSQTRIYLDQAVKYVVVGLAVLVVGGFFLYQSFRLMGNTDVDAVDNRSAIEKQAKAAEAAVESDVEAMAGRLGTAVRTGDIKAYNALVDMDAVSKALGDAYADEAAKAQKLSAAEKSAVRKAYPGILREQQASAVRAKDPSASLFGGEVVAVVQDENGTSISMTGTGAFARHIVFAVSKGKGGYRITGVRNAAEVMAQVAMGL